MVIVAKPTERPPRDKIYTVSKIEGLVLSGFEVEVQKQTFTKVKGPNKTRLLNIYIFSIENAPILVATGSCPVATGPTLVAIGSR